MIDTYGQLIRSEPSMVEARPLRNLDEDPRWREIFKGYAFGVDYREARVASIQDCTKTLMIRAEEAVVARSMRGIWHTC
ncbi:MAG: hypothetical protein NUV74_06910 [Candidatus Brocadiaceae bacterium]|nr:hypothetical protein [Candidatus Brocadiaceae bacterium]